MSRAVHLFSNKHGMCKMVRTEKRNTKANVDHLDALIRYTKLAPTICTKKFAQTINLYIMKFEIIIY